MTEGTGEAPSSELGSSFESNLGATSSSGLTPPEQSSDTESVLPNLEAMSNGGPISPQPAETVTTSLSAGQPETRSPATLEPTPTPQPRRLDLTTPSHEDVVDAAGNEHRPIANKDLAEVAAYTQKPYWEEAKRLREEGASVQAADVADIGHQAVEQVEKADAAMAGNMDAMRRHGEQQLGAIKATNDAEQAKTAQEVQAAQTVAAHAESLPAPAGLGLAAEQLRHDSEAKIAQIQAEAAQKNAETDQKIADTRTENAAKIAALREAHLQTAERAGASLGAERSNDYKQLNTTVANTLRITLEHVHANNPAAFVQTLRGIPEQVATGVRSAILQQLGVAAENNPAASAVKHLDSGLSLIELISEVGNQIDPSGHLRVVERVNAQTGETISISTIMSTEPTTIERRRFRWFGRKETITNPRLIAEIENSIGQQDIMQDGRVMTGVSNPKYSDNWSLLRTRFHTDGYSADVADQHINRLKKQDASFWFRLFFGGWNAEQPQK